MTGIHAFMARDYYTCATCYYHSWKGMTPWCKRNDRAINWDMWGFGCGNYGASDRTDRVEKRRCR